MAILKDRYEVYELTGGVDRLVYVTSDLTDSIEYAKFYLRYEPTTEQVNQLQAYFTRRFTQDYIYRVNGRTVRLRLIRNR